MIKKKIVIFSGVQISHIIPLLELIEALDEYDIYCIGKPEHKYLYTNTSVNYLYYPKDIEKQFNSSELKAINKKRIEYVNSYQKDLFIYYTLLYDVMSIHSINNDILNEIDDIVSTIEPDIILRDSIDIYGKIIGKKRNIRCYGYITNNLYSLDFFKLNTKESLKYLLGIKEFNVESPDFNSSFFEYISNIYSCVEDYLNTYSLDVYHHFDPNDEKNIVLASKLLQPMDNFNEKKYFILNPKPERFESEKEINNELIKFIEDKQDKIVYISTGSFIKINSNFYITLIDDFLKNGFKVIVSSRGCFKEVNDYLIKHSKCEKVYNAEFIPQRYVLSKVDIFISAGGYNSILESLYYGVPMLLIPFSAEQRYNGKIIQEKKLGMSIFEIDDKESPLFKMGIHSLCLTLLTDDYTRNLKKVSAKLKGINYEKEKNNLKKWLNDINIE